MGSADDMLRSVVLCVKVDVVRNILTLPSMRMVSDEGGICRVCSFSVEQARKSRDPISPSLAHRGSTTDPPRKQPIDTRLANVFLMLSKKKTFNKDTLVRHRTRDASTGATADSMCIDRRGSPKSTSSSKSNCYRGLEERSPI
jgi:hypothetical protein